MSSRHLFPKPKPFFPSSQPAQYPASCSIDCAQESGGWPSQLYVREGRRMLGAYVFTQNDRQYNLSKQDSIGAQLKLLICYTGNQQILR